MLLDDNDLQDIFNIYLEEDVRIRTEAYGKCSIYAGYSNEKSMLADHID